MANMFARPEPPPRRAIVAAAHKVNLDRSDDARRSIGRTEAWQEDVISQFDSVGQLKHAARLIGDALSSVHIFVGEVQGDPNASPEPTDDPQAKAPLDRLRANSEGLATMISEHAIHGVTVGECYLVGLAPRDSQGKPSEDGQERWFIASIREVSGSDPVRVKDPDDPLLEIDLISPSKAEAMGVQHDFLARMWQRHPFKGSSADSSFRGIITDAKEYLLFGKTIRAIARTRMTSAGFLKVPDELDFTPIEDMPKDMDPFMQILVQATMATMKDEGNANAAIPIVVRGAGEHLDQFTHMAVERPLDRLWMELRELTIQHMAQGLPMPVEWTTGLGQATHWNGGLIDRNAFRQYLEPLLIWICNCWTRGYLWPSYEAAGLMDPRKYVVWFDASDMVTDLDRTDNATKAHEKGLISDDTYREVLGFSAADKPKAEELAARAERQGANDPAQPETTDPNALPEEPVLAAAGQDIGALLDAIDCGLQERLEGAATIAMDQSLIRAGNRLKSRAQRDKALTASLSNVRPKDTVATAGRATTAALASSDELLADAWTELGDSFETWVSAAQEQALDLVPGLGEIERREAQLEQSRSRRRAWSWLSAQLDTRATEVMHDSSQAGSLTQMIREALGRAGG